MVRLPSVVLTLWLGLLAKSTLADQDYASIILPSINRMRLSVNLPVLCVSDRLSAIAQDYADKQAAFNQGGHAVDGTLPRQRVPGAKPLRELLVEGLGVASAKLAFTQLNISPSHKRALLLPALTHIGVGRGATTDAASGQAYYYWTILVAGLPTPCPSPRPVVRTGRKGVAEWVAPPEEAVQATDTFAEPVPGAGGMETLRRTRKRFLDTVPRIVDGSQVPPENGQLPIVKRVSAPLPGVPIVEVTKEYRGGGGDVNEAPIAAMPPTSPEQRSIRSSPGRSKKVEARYEAGYPPYSEAAEAEPPARYW